MWEYYGTDTGQIYSGVLLAMKSISFFFFRYSSVVDSAFQIVGGDLIL